MKYSKLLLFFLFLLTGKVTFAQSEPPSLKLSIQTDLLAYAINGGYNVWAVAQYNQNQLSVAYVNDPIRYSSYYLNTGLKERDQFIRVGLARYLNTETINTNLFYGLALEFHARTLEEVVTRETINDTHFQVGPMIGYNWEPWSKKENFLQNISIMPWASAVYRTNTDEVTFSDTGNVYEMQPAFAFPLGLNLNYTFYKE